METRIIMHALAARVLAVASVHVLEEGEGERIGLTEGDIFDWSVYIDAVMGMNHEDEMEEVLRFGSKLPVEVAHVLFPEFDVKRYRR